MLFDVSDSVWLYAKEMGREWLVSNFPRPGNPGMSFAGRKKLHATVQSKLNDGNLSLRITFDQSVVAIPAAACKLIVEGDEVNEDGFILEPPPPDNGDGINPGEDEDEFAGLDRNNDIRWEFGGCDRDPRDPASIPKRVNPTLNGAFFSFLLRDTNNANVVEPGELIWRLFEAFFPTTHIREYAIPLTNEKAGDEWGDDQQLTEGEFYVFIGLACYMMVHRVGGDRRRYWTWKGDDLFPGADLGRYMEGRRFESIIKYLTLGDNYDEDDKLREWRDWLDAVRDRFSSAVTPGREITVDETMIENKNFEKADAIVYIKRKPAPWGHEFWTGVDCLSGVMVYFMLNEGAAVMRQRADVREFGTTCAVTLQMVCAIFVYFLLPDVHAAPEVASFFILMNIHGNTP